ncbi:dTMP kinase [Streptomyces sp. MUSC 125]|uniref:dTMP kinase n=1 Tax=Streptomyces sp. MUSC 125 TaxID=1428624 RepID=UPI00057E0702|nr:dTMP kinase [Streptomyces sp. MUSC 125]KIE23725.1 dTMP kinase [Streptomyces sp. MUSC 125]
MNQLNQRYPFIVVEGLDGTGKTTLRKGLFRLWEGLYGVTPLCVLTTNFLAPDQAAAIVAGKYRPDPGNRDSYLSAIAADKRATLERLVLPQRSVRPVIADRWLLSELAFFAVKHGMKASETYQALAADLAVAPDLTLVLDLETDASMSRARARQGDAVRSDWDVSDVQRQVRETYEAVLTKPDAFPLLGDVVRLDARRLRAEVLLAAWDVLRERRMVPPLTTPAEEVHADGGDSRG